MNPEALLTLVYGGVAVLVAVALLWLRPCRCPRPRRAPVCGVDGVLRCPKCRGVQIDN